MTADLHGLYQRIILDHYRNPRNYRSMEPGRSVEGHNPLCGDRLTVYLRLEQDRIADLAPDAQRPFVYAGYAHGGSLR